MKKYLFKIMIYINQFSAQFHISHEHHSCVDYEIEAKSHQRNRASEVRIKFE